MKKSAVIVFLSLIIVAIVASFAMAGSVNLLQKQSGVVGQAQVGNGLNVQGYVAVGAQGYLALGSVTATKVGLGTLSTNNLTGIGGGFQGTGMAGFQANLGSGQAQGGFYKQRESFNLSATP